MKMNSRYVVIAAALMALATAAWPQATLTAVNGKVLDGGKPLAGAQVILKSLGTGKTYKAKTDKSGTYSLVGVVRGDYSIVVQDAGGQPRFKIDHRSIQGEGGANEVIPDIDISAKSKMTKEEREKIETYNAKARSINALIEPLNKALAAKDWKTAEPLLQQAIVTDPNRWEFYSALGDAQNGQAEYDDAVASYQKGIEMAQGVVSGTSPKDPKNPSMDPVKAKAGLGQMLTGQGNAYLKLKKNPQAIDAFTKAAAMDPNPGVAYFNLCATQYNSGNAQDALTACDKAIAADPNKADAYYIKGALMVGQSTMSKDGKILAPAGTEDTLNKYLQLAPDGPHANDVKQMLQAMGAKVATTFKSGKKKK